MEIRYGSDMTGHGDSLASKLEEYDNLTGIIERLDEHSVRHGGQGEIYRAKLEASRATMRVIQKLRLAACSERNPGADDGSDSGVYLVAVKVFREFAEMDMESQNRRLLRQVRAWGSLLHQNVLPLLGFTYHLLPNLKLASLVSPWMPLGSARQYLEYHSAGERTRMLKGIASGLSYLHSNSVIHGDLKGDNIMIGGDIQPRLADFGLSTLLDEQITESLQNNIGSFRWTARERFLDRPQSTFESDVWSFGMTAMELFTSQTKSAGAENKGVDMDDDIWEICLDCWKEDPESRPSSNALEKRLIETYSKYHSEGDSLCQSPTSLTSLPEGDSKIPAPQVPIRKPQLDDSSVDTSYMPSNRVHRPPIRGRAHTCDSVPRVASGFAQFYHRQSEGRMNMADGLKSCPWLSNLENMEWFLSHWKASPTPIDPSATRMDQDIASLSRVLGSTSLTLERNRSPGRYSGSVSTERTTRRIADNNHEDLESACGTDTALQCPSSTSTNTSDSYNVPYDPTLPDLVPSGLSSSASSRHTSRSDPDHRPILIPDMENYNRDAILDSLENVFEEEEEDNEPNRRPETFILRVAYREEDAK